MAKSIAQHNLRTIAGMALFTTVGVAILPPVARAQAKGDPGQSASVFDDDKSAEDTKGAKKASATKTGDISDRETIGFSQQNAAAQMNELEERMFRLSEALRGLEPENASRLKLALKFSREEQILEQMREANKLLKEAQLTKAETEAKELIAKLQHLRNLLLAEDLDFQLKLARLRQMRETQGQLERIIKEQRRLLGWTRFAMEERKRLARYAARRPDLETLVNDQQAVMADTKSVSQGGEKSAAATGGVLRDREAKIRTATSALAADPLFADLQPPHLRRADASLAESIKSLESSDVNAAAAAQDQALALLKTELTRLDNQVAQAEKSVAAAEFQRRAADQTRNRQTAETLQETSNRLGDVAIGLRKDLIRAGASMRTAEQKMTGTAASAAADDQTSALDVLAKTREEFARSIERLLVELRAELQTRLISELTEMHELETAVRETTQAQAPRLAQKSRTALIAVASLAKSEAALAERTEHLLGLVEETEFGIALPTTLRILGREMRRVEGWLKETDAGPRTVAFETRLEEDLHGLLQAVRRLPPTTPPPPGSPLSTEARERERELNRLIAELKMVRMIQSRLNDETVQVDKTRPVLAATPSALRREVETLESTQDEIRDSLAKIAERLPFPEDNPQ